MEFDLSSLYTLLAGGAVINGVQLQLNSANSAGQEPISVRGYEGNGLLSVADAIAGTNLGSFTPPIFSAFPIDVSAFVAGLLAASDTYAGFNVRETNQNYNGSVNFGANNTSRRPLLIVSYTPANQTPSAVDDTFAIKFNETANLFVLTSGVADSDPDGNALTISAVGALDAAIGDVSISADKSFLIFNPNDSFSGKASFSYTISDGNGGTDSADVTVWVGTNQNGGNGRDTLRGNDGNDFLSGGNGDDILYGFAGADILNGGNGDDTLIGGAGSDIVTGGNGADVFVLAAGDGADTFTDFKPGTDQIALSSGLKYTDLYLQGNNIFKGVGSELLATLQNVQTSTLSQSNFIPFAG